MKTTEILNQLKLIIFDSGIEKDMIEYDVKYNPSDDYVHYFIKFKNSDKYILKDETRSGYIPKYETENALKMLTSFTKVNKNKNLNIETYDMYWNTDSVNGKHLYAQPVVSLKENPNILFFPELELLYFSKYIKLHGNDFVPQALKLDFYRENVTPENFEIKTRELIELFNTPINDLVTISTVRD